MRAKVMARAESGGCGEVRGSAGYWWVVRVAVTLLHRVDIEFD